MHKKKFIIIVYDGNRVQYLGKRKDTGEWEMTQETPPNTDHANAEFFDHANQAQQVIASLTYALGVLQVAEVMVPSAWFQ